MYSVQLTTNNITTVLLYIESEAHTPFRNVTLTITAAAYIVDGKNVGKTVKDSHAILTFFSFSKCFYIKPEEKKMALE